MKLTVVIPVRDETATIAPLLDSLLDQTLTPAEIVVVDGGPTDDTRGIVQRYARDHSHIRLLCDQTRFPAEAAIWAQHQPRMNGWRLPTRALFRPGTGSRN